MTDIHISSTTQIEPPSHTPAPPTFQPQQVLPPAYSPQQVLPPAYPPAYIAPIQQPIYPPVPTVSAPAEQDPVLVAEQQGLKQQVLDNLVQKYNILTPLQRMLCYLREFDFVILCDDSGSMSAPCTYQNADGSTQRDTRWTEAHKFVMSLLDYTLALDDDGIDLFFMNRPNVHVNTKSDIDAAFQKQPNGSTPLVRTMNTIFEKYKSSPKNIMLIVVTDGVPDEPTKDLEEIISKMITFPNPKYRISLVLATDDDAVVELFSKIDTKFDCFDVSDDFISEKNQIMKVQGRDFKFTYGDYICKILLAPICTALDNLDEKRVDLDIIVSNFIKEHSDNDRNHNDNDRNHTHHHNTIIHRISKWFTHGFTCSQ